MTNQVGNTREERERIIEEVNANFAIEGMKPDESDKHLQQQFIDGFATIEDMLKHAQEFAAKHGGQQS